VYILILPFLFFAFIALYNGTESTIMVRNSIFWVLYVVLTVQLDTDYQKRGGKEILLKE